MATIQGVLLVKDKSDDWVWDQDPSGSYTTKYGYLVLEKQSLTVQPLVYVEKRLLGSYA